MMNYSEFPYSGVITRTTTIEEDNGDVNVTTSEIYNGVMDYSLNTAVVGLSPQTADYVVSMPLTKNVSGNYIMPRKGDKITISVYGDLLSFTVVNKIPSQVGGITVYASSGSI
jgi:hypothetical protein